MVTLAGAVFSNCFVPSGQVPHSVQAFKIQAGSLWTSGAALTLHVCLLDQTGLSVSTGPRGDSSSALKVVPMHSASFWPSSPLHCHLKSQMVHPMMHHGLAGLHIANPMHSGDGVSHYRGRCHSAGACWAPSFQSSRKSSPGEAVQAPRSSECLLSCAWQHCFGGGGPACHSVTQVDNSHSILALVNQPPLEFWESFLKLAVLAA